MIDKKRQEKEDDTARQATGKTRKQGLIRKG